jgi:peptidoglycan/LPS O-acetylase OafA/YrhL
VFVSKWKKFWDFSTIDYLLLLRIIFIFLVFRQHFARIYYPEWGDFRWLWFGNGGAGEYAVIFFFALSGYLHTKNLLNLKTWNFGVIKEFYIKRLVRLLPLFFITNILFLLTLHRYYLINQNWDKVLQIFTFRYFLEFPFNQVIWFVNIELLYILILPILVWFFYKNSFKLNLFFGLFLYILIYFGLSKIPQPWPQGLFYKLQIVFPLLTTIIYKPIIDILNMIKNYFNFSKNQFARIFGIVFVSSLLLFVFPYQFSKFYSSLFLIPIAIILFWLYDQAFEYLKIKPNLQNSYKNISNFINYLGNISFAIYLTHMAVIIKFGLSFGSLETKLLYYTRMPVYIINLIVIFIGFGMSVILGAIIYEIVEKPSSKFLLKKLL